MQQKVKNERSEGRVSLLVKQIIMFGLKGWTTDFARAETFVRNGNQQILSRSSKQLLPKPFPTQIRCQIGEERKEGNGCRYQISKYKKMVEYGSGSKQDLVSHFLHNQFQKQIKILKGTTTQSSANTHQQGFYVEADRNKKIHDFFRTTT